MSGGRKGVAADREPRFLVGKVICCLLLNYSHPKSHVFPTHIFLKRTERQEHSRHSCRTIKT